MSPTQRALKLLRGRGWKVAICEKWNAFAKIRIDVFGFGDLLAINPNEGEIILVQCCAGASHAARKTKIINIPEAADWIMAGGLILLLSFRKNAKGRYDAREEYIKI